MVVDLVLGDNFAVHLSGDACDFTGVGDWSDGGGSYKGEAEDVFEGGH